MNPGIPAARVVISLIPDSEPGWKDPQASNTPPLQGHRSPAPGPFPLFPHGLVSALVPSSTRSQFLCFCASLSAPSSSLFLLPSPLLFLPGSPPPASLPRSPLLPPPSSLSLSHTPPLGPPLSLRLHFLRRRGPGSPVGGPDGTPGLQAGAGGALDWWVGILGALANLPVAETPVGVAGGSREAEGSKTSGTFCSR